MRAMMGRQVNEDTTPQVGDKCCADPEEEGKFVYGRITKIEGDLAYSDLEVVGSSDEFCGDLPTKKKDGVWLFDSF